jgi:3',5'-cyclic AMP phosphodiesterase CpdA
VLIAQLTDTHVMPPGISRRRMGDTLAHLDRAVGWIRALSPAPDAVVVTGDLTDGASALEYERVREALRGLVMPCYVIPGNHDRRAPLRAAFEAHAYLPRGEGPLHYAVDDHVVRLVGFDSTRRGFAGGAPDGDSLAWLDATLAAAPERPTLLLLHHPPFRTGMHYMDAFGFINLRPLREIIQGYAQVRLVLSGHVHRAFQTTIGEATAWTSPSTAPQIVPELFERRLFWLRFERPGVSLHRWDEGSGTFVSRLYRAERDGTFVEATGEVTHRPEPRRPRATPAAGARQSAGSYPIRPS